MPGARLGVSRSLARPMTSPYAGAVAEVDVGDDGIRRYVVRHYRYDPQRHERRHVLVAAFDDRRDYEACLRAVHADIERRRAAGEPVDRREHATGTVYEPGHLARAAAGHLARRMMEHGVDPAGRVAAQDLPRNMAFFGPGASDGAGRRGRLARLARRVLRRPAGR